MQISTKHQFKQFKVTILRENTGNPNKLFIQMNLVSREKEMSHIMKVLMSLLYNTYKKNMQCYIRC